MAKTINVNGLEVSYKAINEQDYICLTDMARHEESEATGYVITRFLSSKYTIEFMGIWERFNNPDFNVVEFYNIRNESGGHNYVLTAKKWLERTKAIGIISNTGRYGGTYAHKDIAFEFATWLSAEFKYYMITEFQRLKADEQKQLQWSATRELAKVNYHTQTSAIREHLIIPTLTEQQKLYKYTDEADLLNVALFGHTAKQWREANPDKAKIELEWVATHTIAQACESMVKFNQQGK